LVWVLLPYNISGLEELNIGVGGQQDDNLQSFL
jgi:hypothetical protein